MRSETIPKAHTADNTVCRQILDMIHGVQTILHERSLDYLQMNAGLERISYMLKKRKECSLEESFECTL